MGLLANGPWKQTRTKMPAQQAWGLPCGLLPVGLAERNVDAEILTIDCLHHIATQEFLLIVFEGKQKI